MPAPSLQTVVPNAKMIKILIFYFLVTFPQCLLGQTDEGGFGKDLVCTQIELIKDYIKADKEFRLTSFRIDTLIRDGWGYSLFANEYVANKLNVPEKEMWNQDRGEVGKLFKSLENKPYLSGDSPYLDCISGKRRPNMIISKVDYESILVNITTSRQGKEGASGQTYLFFFDGPKIRSVFQANWIE